jgi:hypothetical protein
VGRVGRVGQVGRMGQVVWSVRPVCGPHAIPTHLTYPAHLAYPTYFTETVQDTGAFSGG